MPSIEQLFPCAETHLSEYISPSGNRAFQAYDRVGDATRLEPLDFLAPALLDAPLRGEHVIAMFRPDGPYRELRDAMSRVLADPPAAGARFEDLDLAAETGPWSLVRAALVASARLHT